MSNVILYRPELRQAAGSVTAAILLNQMTYWWDKTGGKPFYKFKEPCKHSAYKAGDSWCEELAFTRSEFDSALKKLISKGFVSKKVTRDRLTIYTVSESALSAVKKPVYLDHKSEPSQSRKDAFDIQKTITVDYQENTNNTPASEPDLPEALQAQDKIVVCDSILQDEKQKIEKPDAISDETYTNILPALKKLPVKKANQVLQLVGMAIKDGSIRTTVERMAGGLIKAALAGTLDASRLDRPEKPAQTHPSQHFWRSERSESPDCPINKASRAAGLASLEKLLKELG